MVLPGAAQVTDRTLLLSRIERAWSDVEILLGDAFNCTSLVPLILVLSKTICDEETTLDSDLDS